MTKYAGGWVLGAQEKKVQNSDFFFGFMDNHMSNSKYLFFSTPRVTLLSSFQNFYIDPQHDYLNFQE